MQQLFERFHPYRKDQTTRDRYADVTLDAKNFIQPYFVVHGQGVRKPIVSLTGVNHLSPDELLKDLQLLQKIGIDKILLFGVVDRQYCDAEGSYAADDASPVAQAVRAVKKAYPYITVMTDVCICAYTDHGHCGLVHEGKILNDETLPQLAAMAITHARAGADYVAPSAMMDGQVAAIRKELDKQGYGRVHILSYSAKYASHFYGPFRDAVDSSPRFGDRKSYQMDYRNSRLALAEARADMEEGASALMVKPACSYMDVLQRIKDAYPKTPLAAYHVSGEYMMLKAAAKAGVVDEHKALHEIFYGLRRAGADWIISYAAQDFCKILRHFVTPPLKKEDVC